MPATSRRWMPERVPPHGLGWTFPADATALLLFARDWERKGGRLFLETVRELTRLGRRVLAVIVGAPERGRTETRALGWPKPCGLSPG
ncbi:MAG: hypothetical protein M3Z95_07000 [Actinomycetota bacterium]|nr:hypothetical protein [Actinomycetota bacterium]